ncbi:hypothetical protein [Eubacterium ramulus]
MKRASEIRDQAQEVTDVLKVYENDFDMYLHLFCEENNIDDLKKESQSIWNACLYYIYSHVFKGTNQLKSTKLYDNPLLKTNNNAYNYDLLLDIVDIYIYKLCMQYDKEVSLLGFSTLTGISNGTLIDWGNNRNKLSNGGYEIYKKLMTFNEESLSDKLVTGKQNPVGVIAVLNRRHGWASPYTSDSNRQRTALTADQLPKLGRNKPAELCDNQTQLENNNQ